MRVLLFNLRTDVNHGVLGFTTEWINALADRCEKIYVVSTSVGLLQVRNNVEVFDVNSDPMLPKFIKLLKFYKIIFYILKNERIDVCFAHMNYLFPILAYPLLKLRQIPIVTWYAHGHVPILLHLATWMSKSIVTSSQSGFRIKTNKLKVIGQGIDTNRFNTDHKIKRNNSCRILSFGRISPVKRIELLIEAIRLIKLENPHEKINCNIVGDPLNDRGKIYLLELKSLVVKYKLSSIIKFYPGVPFTEAYKVFSSADIFVNTGDTDSVDKTVLEAMSSGLLVLTSNLAFQQIFTEEIRNIYMIPKNNPSILAHKIVLLSHYKGNELNSIIRNGRNFVIENHSLNKLAEKIVGCLLESRSC